jgi:phage shock protein A
LRLLRREVESLVKQKHGAGYPKAQRTKTEVARINRELKRLRTQIAALEEQKSQLTADFARSEGHS